MPDQTSAVAIGTSTDSRSPSDLWLDGNSVMCACPDCQAPMSIRLWLMAADCWQCGCSVELTEQQEREIQSVLRVKQRQVDALTQTTVIEEQSTDAHNDPQRDEAVHSNTPIPAARLRESPRTEPSSPSFRAREHKRVPLPNKHPRLKRPAGPSNLLTQTRRRSFRDWLDQMPAWLVSLLFHMALLALLALLIFEGDVEDPYITLSTEANRWREIGGQVHIQNPDDTIHYDLPLPEKDAPKTPRQRSAIVRANQIARELRIDPDTVLPQLSSLRQVKQTLRSDNSVRRTLAARDPRIRVQMVTREGGTTLTEAAVARGLRWMEKHQDSDGSWSLHRFAETQACRGRCRNHGSLRSDSAATALCLLPYLGAGQTHQVGLYQDVVSKGLRWLLQNQLEDGNLSAGSQQNTAMYAHGQGTIVLCEAFALTRDEQLRDAAQRSVDFIVYAQHHHGGWRYRPGEQGDTSVLGWQLMALQSARAAELDVPQETLDLSTAYLDSVQYDDGALYAYQPDRQPTHVMTSEALLCRMYLGWTKDYAGLDQGVKFLIGSHLPNRKAPNFYYWYYATQVLHHYGGKSWDKWNIQMRDILVQSQAKRGHEAGSWKPKGGHASQGGRLYSTALAVCTLEVYYRHTPIFRQLEID